MTVINVTVDLLDGSGQENRIIQLPNPKDNIQQLDIRPLISSYQNLLGNDRRVSKFELVAI